MINLWETLCYLSTLTELLLSNSGFLNSIQNGDEIKRFKKKSIHTHTHTIILEPTFEKEIGGQLSVMYQKRRDIHFFSLQLVRERHFEKLGKGRSNSRRTMCQLYVVFISITVTSKFDVNGCEGIYLQRGAKCVFSVNIMFTHTRISITHISMMLMCVCVFEWSGGWYMW